MKPKCCIYMQSCSMQQETEEPTRYVTEVFKCFMGLQNKMHMFRKYFLSFTTSKIIEKVELTKHATGKTKASLCRQYDICLDAAMTYSGTIKPSTKTCALQRFGIKLFNFYKM